MARELFSPPSLSALFLSPPSLLLFPFRLQPILSSPPSTLTLPIYICLYPYPLSHQPHYYPSVPSLFYLLHLLPLLFLSTYTRTIYLTLPLPSLAYSISSTFCPYPFYLPIPAPSTSLFPFRPQPILSPPPSTLTLPIYTHSLLPLASLFPPVPCLFSLPSSFGRKG